MEKEYECEQVPVIINVPHNTVKLNVKATVMEDDNSLREAEMTMNTAQVMEARISGKEWEQENATYCLTDYGRELLDEIE